MLKKLLKYDLKWCLKVVTIYLSICLVFSIIGRLIDLCPDSIFFKILGGVCKGAALSFGITGLVNAIIRSWVRMTNNMYKDESYLTHTIPVSINKIYLSKIISTFMILIICIITIIMSLVIMYLNDSTIEMLKTSLNIISNNLNVSIAGFVCFITLLLIAEMIFITFCGYFGIIFGYSFNNKKIMLTLLFGFGSYIVFSILSIVLMMIIAIFNEDLNNIMFKGSEVVNYNLFKSLILIVTILYTLYSGIVYYISNKKLSKGINID
ncbi:MAG: hypothetical protein J6K18_05085 [Bacilli bacterium]|nr:hypothetical protein [Bacilli bacterium]